MADIGLVVTDLDGTLWDERQEVHPRTYEALAELERRGIPVLAATGRRRRSTRAGFEHTGIRLPAVLLNGSLGHDFTAGTDFHRLPFEREAALALLELFDCYEHGPCVYTDASEGLPDAYVGTIVTTCDRHVELLGPNLGRRPLEEVAGEHGVLGFSILGRRRDELADLAAALEEAGLASVAFTEDHLYGEWSLMVAPSGVSKWTGVLAWCEQQDIDPGTVLAIGDGGNDIELLEGAAVAVTVEDGTAAAAAVADHVVGSPKDGGWADLLEII